MYVRIIKNIDVNEPSKLTFLTLHKMPTPYGPDQRASSPPSPSGRTTQRMPPHTHLRVANYFYRPTRRPKT